MHQSISTISSPEFINLQPLDINPLMSKCEIKVFYVGENRNGSFISKEVATEMAKTLRGAPIVGYFKKEDGDFGDHGEQVIIDGDGVKFNCLTKPYGFVAPDAKVWFQKFDDFDDFGNSIEKEYLMTTGFLWTGQFEECKLAVEGEGRPHSMELDEKSLQGHWAENYKNGMDFFIINDATFSKLCILGDGVEPCFEGSSVSSPKISSSFTLVDDDFKYTLYNMMQELKTALGGGNMEEEKTIVEAAEPIQAEAETPVVESEFVASSEEKKEEEKDNSEFAAKDDKKEEEDSASDDSKEEDTKDASSDEENASDDKDEEDKKKTPPTKSELIEEAKPEVEMIELEKFTQLQSEYDSLKNQYSALEEQMEALTAFKNQIEDKEKDELIDSFYMLDDADKKEYIENKSKYTYDEIKKELSVICFDKKVNFVTEQKKEKEAPVTFDLHEESNLPAWVQAVKEVQSNI